MTEPLFKRRVSVTEFLALLSSDEAVRPDGTRWLEHLEIDAAETQGILDLSSIPYPAITLRRCALPQETSFHAGPTLEHITLDEVVSPGITVCSGIRSAAITANRVGNLDIEGGEVTLAGHFDRILVAGAARTEVRFGGVRTDTLWIYARGGKTAIGAYDEDGQDLPPLIVSRYIRVADPGIAHFLRLLCPTTPIHCNGSIADL